MVSGENNAHTAHLGAETPRSQGLREALEQSERGAGMASPLAHARFAEWPYTHPLVPAVRAPSPLG